MRHFWIMLSAILAVVAAAPARAQERPEGDWLGTLPPAQLHLAVHVRRTAGGLSGTMDSLDQGLIGAPLDGVKAEGDGFAFDVPSVGGHYAGRWDGAAGRYAGEWIQPGFRQPLLLARGTAAPRPVVAGLDGDWDGRLKGELRVVLHIRTGPGGTVGTVDSPDQEVTGIPVSALSRAGETVRVEVRAIGSGFEGRLTKDGGTLEGRWTQITQQTPLVLRRRARGAAAPAAAPRPQTPKRPFPYRELDVSFDNPGSHDRLGGTLTLPGGTGPFPAALLITGSGPQDRDETIMGHKPFLVLADYLTRRGIAVLRLDDRGVGGSTGDPGATTLDLATDTEAGLAWLAARPEIDGRRIGLVGHSEGGVIAAMVAARQPSAAWIVLLAGFAVPGEQVVLSQQRLLAAAAGVPKPAIERSSAVQQRLLAAIRSAPDRASAAREAQAVLIAAGIPAPGAQAQAQLVSSDWYRGFLRLDPVPALKAVKVPVLALVGSLDLQVPAAENIPALKAALAGNRDAAVVELPGLNHLFQTARTGAVSEYAQIEETFSPAALKLVGDWIAAHTK